MWRCRLILLSISAVLMIAIGLIGICCNLISQPSYRSLAPPLYKASWSCYTSSNYLPNRSFHLPSSGISNFLLRPRRAGTRTEFIADLPHWSNICPHYQHSVLRTLHSGKCSAMKVKLDELVWFGMVWFGMAWHVLHRRTSQFV